MRSGWLGKDAVMRLLDRPSNVKVSEAACADAEAWMHGYGCHSDCSSHATSAIRIAACVVQRMAEIFRVTTQ
jgi:hypothetical protein